MESTPSLASAGQQTYRKLGSGGSRRQVRSTERSFASVGELSEAIICFLAARNKNAKRYV
jgi:hypothetical protein